MRPNFAASCGAETTDDNYTRIFQEKVHKQSICDVSIYIYTVDM